MRNAIRRSKALLFFCFFLTPLTIALSQASAQVLPGKERVITFSKNGISVFGEGTAFSYDVALRMAKEDSRAGWEMVCNGDYVEKKWRFEEALRRQGLRFQIIEIGEFLYSYDPWTTISSLSVGRFPVTWTVTGKYVVDYERTVRYLIFDPLNAD